MQKQLHVLMSLILSVVFLAGCGTFNVNKIFGSDDKALDTLLVGAQAAYDRGDFKEARELAEQAQRINGSSEQTVVLLGYIHLSLAGIDPFQIGQKLIDLNSTTTSDTSGATAQEQTTNSTADQLKNLSVVLSLTDTDKKAMAKSTSTNSDIWNGLDIIIPKKAISADADNPRLVVNTLLEVNNVIALICPFVDPDVLVETQAVNGIAGRHSCQSVSQTRHLRAKAHVLWALAHLTEGLAFNPVLLYSSGTDVKTPNIQKRVDVMNTKTYTAAEVATTYLSQIQQVSKDVDEVFDTSSDSMLTATLNDMQSFLNGMKKAGVPDSMVKAVQSAIDKLRDTAKQLGSKDGTDTATQTKALRGQMSDKVSKTVATKLDAIYKANPNEFNANKSAICAQYATMSIGIPDASKTVPAGCK